MGIFSKRTRQVRWWLLLKSAMATVIQIKRTYSADPPTTNILEEGELAYSQDSTGDGANAILYIEALGSNSNAVLHKVGGKYYTDIIDSANTEIVANTLVLRDMFGNFSANIIVASSFSGNIDGGLF